MKIKYQTPGGTIAVERPAGPSGVTGSMLVDSSAAALFIKLGAAAAQAGATVGTDGKVAFAALDPATIITNAIRDKTDI